MERVNTSLPDKLATQLREIAEETGASMADLIRRAVYEFVTNFKPKG